MVEKEEQEFISDIVDQGVEVNVKEVKKTTINMEEEGEDGIIRAFINSIYGDEYLKNSIDLKEIFKYVNQKDASLLKQDIFNLLLRYKIKKDIQDYIDNDDADLSKIIKFIVETMDDLEWFYRGVKMGKKAYTLMIDERIAEAGKKDAADYGVTFDQYVQDLIEQDVSVEFLEEEEEE